MFTYDSYDVEPTGKGTWHQLDDVLNVFGETPEEAREYEAQQRKLEAQWGADY